MKPVVVADYKNIVGEGPLWHPKKNILFWIDIMAGRIFTLDPSTGDHSLFHQGGILGGFTFQADDSLLLFMEKNSVAILKDGETEYLIDKDETLDEDARFNDVISDPKGRVFCGTMPTDNKSATLYRMDLDGSIKTILTDVGLSNGLGFTPDGSKLYYTDSYARKIYIFDYDIETGDIENQRTFVETPEGDGIPDGMTVDVDGNVWSARANGSALYRYTPEGVQNLKIDFPAKMVSSAIFGGKNLSDLYVTTIGGNDRENQGSGAGALFKLETQTSGMHEFFSRVCI